MKRTLLLVSLLSIPAAYAGSFESAQSALAAQQSAVDAAERRVEDLKGRLAEGTSQIASAAGKPEYAAEIDRLNEANRKLVEECNQAVAACKAENKKLQDAVARCTGPDREVVTEHGKYSLRPHEAKPVASSRPASVAQPVQASQAPRAPYARHGRTYPRANQPIVVSE